MPPDPAGDVLDPHRRRGRGAASNPAIRYERLRAERADDGWTRAPEDDLPPVRTHVIPDRSRTILARNTSPDVPFDRSINPYRGCEHGCTYCFARPSHAQLGYSPGLDFETRLVVKPEAARLLDATLRRPGYLPRPIAIGTNTDAYQPIEKDYRIMREVLEVLWAFRHPVTVTTKGALVLRDLDLLGRLGRAGLASVAISLTTLDHRLSRAMEPRAAAPTRRVAAIRALAGQGVPVHVNTSPIVPALNDHELERLLEAAALAGARSASYTTLRLPLEVSALFQEWLRRYCPDRADRVMGRVREMHGGRDYDPAWGKRMKGEGVHAKLIARRFAVATARFGFDAAPATLRTDLFAVPARPGDQLSLGL
ncbi:MAG: PA0069 family radical SAM protein [Paracoccaceae bacterium]